MSDFSIVNRTAPVGGIRALDSAKGLYTLPLDDFVAEVLVPALKVSTQVDCMMGFFDSAGFVTLAPGLAAFLNRKSGTMRIIMSPAVSQEDEDALRVATESPALVLARAAERLFRGAEISELALVKHQYDCLAYMVAADRLQIKFSWVNGGMFHPKVWVLRDDTDVVVLHGSSNFTSRGLAGNLETIAVERPWR